VSAPGGVVAGDAPASRASDDDRDPQQEVIDFYRGVIQTLDGAGIPYLVGGAYALAYYTRVPYETKDFDLFLLRGDFSRACDILNEHGYRAELVFPHFLGKVYDGDHFVDLIFGSGNGVVSVDEQWFTHASAGEVFGLPVRFCAIEEIVWSKAFIMERERYDGGDIAHVLLATGDRMDWGRLLERFGPYWRVLLAHLVLFGFVYPGQRSLVPSAVLNGLLDRLRHEADDPNEQNLCRGGLLSRRQYLLDLNELGMQDARLQPVGTMTREEIDDWTEASEDDD
jgi:hypothetical protein